MRCRLKIALFFFVGQTPPILSVLKINQMLSISYSLTKHPGVLTQHKKQSFLTVKSLVNKKRVEAAVMALLQLITKMQIVKSCRICLCKCQQKLELIAFEPKLCCCEIRSA